MNTVVYEGKEYRIFNYMYAVSEDGSLLRQLQPCQPHIRNDGYSSASKFLVHRMVAACWVPNPESRNTVHHIDGNKANNAAYNLEWVTPKIHNSERHIDVMGKHVCPEWVKIKNREMRLGTKLSEEHKKRIAESAKKHFADPGNLARYRESLKTRTHHGFSQSAREKHKIPCVIDGITYDSVKDASVALGIKQGTIRRRLLSKNFTNYTALKPITNNDKYPIYRP